MRSRPGLRRGLEFVPSFGQLRCKLCAALAQLPIRYSQFFMWATMWVATHGLPTQPFLLLKGVDLSARSCPLIGVLSAF